MVTQRITAPFKYPGSKWSYADWIVSHFPRYKVYLEPFFGSGAVFFKKPLTSHETINDLDGHVVNFFKVCREYPDELAQAIALTPFSWQEFLQIQEDHAGEEIKLSGEPIEDARRFAVRCCQAHGNKIADRAGWKNSKNRSGPNNPQIWNKVPETIYAVAERLKNAQIEQTDAIQLIKDYNAPECLIYLDPPYVGETRDNKRIYRKEMLDKQSHAELLKALLDHKGPVILSGYDNALYNNMLPGWHKEYKAGRADSTAIRTEVIWMNFQQQMKMF